MSEFKRGEVYWVKNKLNKETGEKKARPALIISTPEDGDEYADTNVVYLTHNPSVERESNIVIEKTNNGYCEGSVAICGKTFSISGALITEENFYCRLSYEDMERVDKALARRLGLDYLLNSSQGECIPEVKVAVAEPYVYEPYREVTNEPKAQDMKLLEYNMENEIKARFYEEKYNELLAMIMNR